MIADEIVERVREAADIVAIVGEFVPLRRSGADFRGACPFHGGTNPNFSVSQKRGSYHCFVCHESGDVFTFVRKRLGLDFSGAVKLIGERVGIEVIDAPLHARVADPNEKNWEVLSASAEWFGTQLSSDVGSAARTYLESRSLSSEACVSFGLGFAPRDPQALRKYLHALGFDDDRQTEAGLIVLREGESQPRTRFQHRVTFPILDEYGHHVGFGARALDDRTPKYLNSPESQVFQKRRTLYGLHSAKQAMRRNSRAIVVEGYLDVMRLAISGIEEVVAPLGTALTEEQATLLTRYASEVFLLYDSDVAGQKATFRSGYELLRQRAVVRVVSLPEGEDPDSYVRSQGTAALESQLTQAIDVFDRQLQILERRGWFADLQHRRRAVDRLLPTIRAARDPLTRDLYISRLAELAGVAKSTIADEADQLPTRRRGAVGGAEDPVSNGESAGGSGGRDNSGNRADGEVPPSPYAFQAKRDAWRARRSRNAGPEWRATSDRPKANDEEPLERALVRAMIIDRALVERVAERHGPEDFRDASYRSLFETLLQVDPEDDLEKIASLLPSHAVERLRDIIDGIETADPASTDISISLARMDARHIEIRMDSIREQMRNEGAAEQDALMREWMELEGERRRLVPIRSPRGTRRS